MRFMVLVHMHGGMFASFKVGPV